jgi:predicted RNA-binding Zn-ribbon protein involved in translation (DUF1610 family)
MRPIHIGRLVVGNILGSKLRACNEHSFVERVKMFGTIKVLAGDFSKNSQHQYMNGTFTMEMGLLSKSEKISICRLSEIEVASEDTVKKIGGTVGWGIAGGIALGPVGLLAGLLLGGKKKEVTFVARFNDGRKMMATTDDKTYLKIKAAHWEKNRYGKPQEYHPSKPIRQTVISGLPIVNGYKCPQCGSYQNKCRARVAEGLAVECDDCGQRFVNSLV